MTEGEGWWSKSWGAILLIITSTLSDSLDQQLSESNEQTPSSGAISSNDVRRVLMFPDFTDGNPYQEELAAGLDEEDITIHLSEYGRYFSVLGSVYQHQPDLVHLHWVENGFVYENSVISAVAGIRFIIEICVLRLFDIPVVWTAHGLTEHDTQSPRVELTGRAVLARCVNALITHCQAAKQAIIREFQLSQRVQRKALVVPHGHYIKSYENRMGRDDARAQLGYDDETVFLYFGRIRGYKKVPALIESFRQVDAPEARLLVVGNPFSDVLESEVRRQADADERVQTVLEYIPRDQVQLYLNAADAVVLGYGGLFVSGVAMLGMSFGRTVIAPDKGCLAEVLDSDSNIKYTHTSDRGLAKAMEQAANADLERMGKRNKEHALKFDWETIAQQTAWIYSQCDGESVPTVSSSRSSPQTGKGSE